jgi:hypothetical protein
MATETNQQVSVCGAGSTAQRLEAADPEYRRKRQESDEFARRIIKRGGVDMTTLYTIPVVFHVVYHTPEENLPLSKILGQLKLLNDCFANRNDKFHDRGGSVPWVFEQYATDAKIEFRLATRDPDGRPTTGITRTYTDSLRFYMEDQFMKQSAHGGIDSWPPERYLNIWTCNLKTKSGSAGSILLGYSVTPGAGTTPPPWDGIVLLYETVSGPHDKSWWDRTYNPTYGAQSKTLVHEVGHYFSLQHLWGDNDDGHQGTGCGDDHVVDTPPQKGPNYYYLFPPTYPYISCNNGPDGDMFYNFMDYTRDDQRVMFTRGQVERMRSCFSWAEYRRSLLSSHALAPPSPVGDAQDWTHGSFFAENPQYSPGNFFADLNGDGLADASLVNMVGQVSVRLSTGFAFGPALTLDDAFTPLFDQGSGRYAFANLTGDGRAAAVLLRSDGSLVVRRWNGAQFDPQETWAEATPELAGMTLTPFYADVDGSGRDHAVIVAQDPVTTACRLYVLRSNVTRFGILEDWTPGGNLPYPAKGVIIADVDGDGRADALLVDSGALYVCQSDGQRFTEPVSWSSRKHDFDTEGDIHFADVIGDGRSHMISLHDRRVLVRRSTGIGFSGVEDWTWPLPTFNQGAQVYFARLSGAPGPDAILFDRNNGILRIRRAQRTSFGPVEDWTRLEYIDDNVHGPYFAQLTGGPTDDIVWFKKIPDLNATVLHIRKNRASTHDKDIILNLGSFTLGERATCFATLTLGSAPDLVLLDTDAIRVRRYTGDKNRPFAPEENWTWHDGPLWGAQGTFFADVTGRGLDAAIVIDDDRITVRPSTGRGFGTPQVWALDDGPLFTGPPTAFARLSGFSLPDTVYVTEDTVTFRQVKGTGFGSLQTRTWHGRDLRGSVGTFLADVDGDGRAEFVLVNEDTVTVRHCNA